MNSNKALTENVEFVKNILILQSEIILFLVQHNGPIFWSSDLAKLLKNCCPEKKELNRLDMYQQNQVG